MRFLYALKMLAVVALIGLAACGPVARESNTPRDLATDLDMAQWSREKYLFFGDGSLVSLAMCDLATRLYDRAHCTGEMHSVSGSLLQEELYKLFGAGADLRQVELSEHQTAIERADFRLIELIRLRPTPVDPSLLPEIEAKISAVAGVDSDIAGLDDQIVRITQMLAQSEDAELRAQLREVQANRAKRLGARIQLNSELNALRLRYVTANSSLIDPSVLQMIQAQRKDHVSGYDRAKIALDKELSDRISAARVLNLISDGGFTYEIMSTVSNELHYVASRLRTAFESARVRYSEFNAVPVSHQKSLDLRVTRHGVLESFKCDLAWNQSGCEKLRLTHAESGFTVVIPSTSFEVSLKYVSHPELAHLLGSNPSGDWRIAALHRARF